MSSLTQPDPVTIAEAIESLLKDGVPVRFTAYDGSSAGPVDASVGLHLKNERGLSSIMTSPGDLGLARAYVRGDPDLIGSHTRKPNAPRSRLMSHPRSRRPSPLQGGHQ